MNRQASVHGRAGRAEAYDGGEANAGRQLEEPLKAAVRHRVSLEPLPGRPPATAVVFH
jgi:hypothetical protein